MATHSDTEGKLAPDFSDNNTGTTTPVPVDLEKTSSQNLTTPTEDAEFKRPISNKSWALVCVGLFLGALLYGEPP
jgi:hypothetical protein